jgi:hypothetical protein
MMDGGRFGNGDVGVLVVKYGGFKSVGLAAYPWLGGVIQSAYS